MLSDPADLRAALERSESTLDRTESILSNISRKSYEDGERLRRQSEVIRRYTPHGIWEEVGMRAARGEYEVPDGEFKGAFLFMDVKGFTSFSESHPPSEVVRELNGILDPATGAVYDCGGDVDKFIGDCLFAAFPSSDAALEADLVGFLGAKLTADLSGEPGREVSLLAVFADSVTGLDVRAWGPAAAPHRSRAATFTSCWKDSRPSEPGQTGSW